MTSKTYSQIYIINPINGNAIDKNILRNGHEPSKAFIFIPIMELVTDGEQIIRSEYKFHAYDGTLNNYDVPVGFDFSNRISMAFDELSKKAIFAELAVFCDVNPIQFVCSCECQKEAIIKAFSGFEDFDAEKSFINI